MDYFHMGLVERLQHGWLLTDKGQLVFMAINREAQWISSGKIAGWSKRLQMLIQSLPRENVVRPFEVSDELVA